MESRKSGFTLVELSIVITIIGLLIGGILAAYALVRQAQSRAVIGEVERFSRGIEEFKTKYGALPGDMYNAENFWGSDTGCPNTPSNTTPKTATCNGDGDGHISIVDDDTPSNTTTLAESFRAWQQLADAGVIDGLFTGVAGSKSSSDSIIGTNVPASAVTGGGYMLYYYRHAVSESPVSVPTFPGDWGHTLVLGKESRGGIPDGMLFTASDAASIDRKIDDGLPGTGKVRTYRHYYRTNCATTDDPATAAYGTGNISKACMLFFILGF